MKIIEVADAVSGGKKAYDILVEKMQDGIKVLGLATGSTPIEFYKQVVASHLDFTDLISINLDEYVGLSPDNPQSYRYFMDTHLLKAKPFKESYLPDGLADNLDTATQTYDKILERYPIDLQILGIGRNGHIGFNEPGTDFSARTQVVNLAPITIEANARFFDDASKVPHQAISMGIASIMSAKTIILMAYGHEKAEAVNAMLTGPITETLPASILQSHPDVIVIADSAALSQYNQLNEK